MTDQPECPHCEAVLSSRYGEAQWDDGCGDDGLVRVIQDSMCSKCGAVMRLVFELSDVSLYRDPLPTTEAETVHEWTFDGSSCRNCGKDWGQRNTPCSKVVCGAYAEHGLGSDGRGCQQPKGHGGNHGDLPSIEVPKDGA